MALLVVAYPKLSSEDSEFIQNYRKENDKRYYDVVNPHITLVFSINDVSEDQFIAEVEKQSKGVDKFEAVFRVATINQDDGRKFFHEFLVPDEGYSNIVKLHDKLYSGVFKKFWRYDIDYIPHIGIGNSDNVKESKDRVDELNQGKIEIACTVDAIDVIKYENDKVETIKSLDLV